MPTIDANGTTISYARTGGGPPVLLIHGAEVDHSMFDGFAPLLARDFTVIAYDQRDSGDTQGPDSPYGLAELADDAAGLIAALGYERAHVFGTSLGGAIAQVLAGRHPRRVDRLVLASTFAVGTPLPSLNPEVFAELARLRAGLPGTAGEIARYFFPDSWLSAHPEVAGLFSGNRRDAAQRQRRAAILGRPAENRLASIAAPTLVMAGDGDRLIPPSHTLSMATRIADARTAVIAGVGHIATIQDPHAVAAAVVPFLKGVTAQQDATSIGGNDHDRAEAPPAPA